MERTEAEDTDVIVSPSELVEAEETAEISVEELALRDVEPAAEDEPADDDETTVDFELPGSGQPGSGQPASGLPASGQPASGLPLPSGEAPASDPLAEAMTVMESLRARVRSQVIGRDSVIDLVLVALLSDGHVLLEDFPGSGKTTLAKALGASIVDDLADDDIASFRRIQFTPDLLPSDVTGVSVFDPVSNRFHFRHGPIFAHVVLADEINRTSPKVQSAMLEAMAEKQVTVDNQTYPLDELFFVIATQNPHDMAGTYPLPVAQLDRFLFKIRMVHIDRQAELEVLNTHRERRDIRREDLPRVTRSQVLAARHAIDGGVAIDAQVKECLVDIAQNIRNDERVLLGSSTRSLVLMLPALQALAALRGRDYVTSDDIQLLVPRVFGHRVDLAPGVTELDRVLADAMEGPIESLARSTLRRR
ncbi:MAG: AAA family ATPase [Acidobacteriota bacterium]